MKRERTIVRSLVMAMALVGLLALAPAGAAMYFDSASSGGTWDDGATSNWALSSAGTYDQPWAGGSGAHFEGTGAAVAVDAGGIASVDSIDFDVTGYSLSGGSLVFTANGATMNIAVLSGTATVGSDITVFGNLGTDQSNILTKSGAGKLILSGTNRIATNTSGNKNSYFKVNGGGEMEVTGTLITTQQVAANKGAPASYVGDASGNNILRVSGTGRLWTNDITVGANGNDNNSIILSSPGTSIDSTVVFYGDSPQLNMNSSGNSLSVTNGAYVANTSGSGSPGWTVGTSAGNNGNSITVDGLGSTIARTSSGFLTAGMGGDNNTITVQNQGTLAGSGKLGIGSTGGDNNYILITGAGSAHNAGNGGSNAWIDIGGTSGSVNNSYRVENGGTLNFGGSGTSRRLGVGEVAGADDNYISITGAASTANFVHTGIPLAIGGVGTGAGVMTDGGTGNHLDVFSGATLDMVNIDGSTTTVPTGSTAIVLLGTSSAFNLGNGTGISTAAVGATTNFTVGVYIKNADGRLNFDSGRLVAGVAGNLVSGAGKVNLDGAAYVSTALANTIATEITGGGSLTKEDIGTLTLTAVNSYTGDTTVAGGILSLAYDYLDDASNVIIAAGGIIDLTHGAVDTIGSLTVDGTPYTGIITGGDYAWITGTGSLQVVPEPATLALLAIGGLAVLGRKRRVA